MYKIAVMGDKDSIYGFASIGLEIIPADDAKTAAHALKKAAEEQYAVVFVTEKLAVQIQDEIEKYSDRICPAIILIPSVGFESSVGLDNISKLVQKAVGSDILD